MEPLRWVLLLIGVLVIGLVFLYSRGMLPTVTGMVARLKALRPKPKPAPEPAAEAEEAPAAEPPPPKPDPLPADSYVITARIMPQPGAHFPAEELVLALRSAGLQHGQFKIFHRLAEDGERIRFSVASLVEPGSFDLSNLSESHYLGISIFMVLPAPEDGVALFDEMMEAARSISKRVDGNLVDEQGGALSVQRERYMREEVIEYLRRHVASLHVNDLSGH